MTNALPSRFQLLHMLLLTQLAVQLAHDAPAIEIHVRCQSESQAGGWGQAHMQHCGLLGRNPHRRDYDEGPCMRDATSGPAFVLAPASDASTPSIYNSRTQVNTTSETGRDVT